MLCNKVLEPKLGDELIYCTDFFSNRVNENTVCPTKNTKRDPREASTCSHVNKTSGGVHRDTIAGKQQKRIKHMEYQRLVNVNDTSEVHLVLHDDKSKVVSKQKTLFLGAIYPIVFEKPLDQLSLCLFTQSHV